MVVLGGGGVFLMSEVPLYDIPPDVVKRAAPLGVLFLAGARNLTRARNSLHAAGTLLTLSALASDARTVAISVSLQGYLAHKKMPPPRTLQ